VFLRVKSKNLPMRIRLLSAFMLSIVVVLFAGRFAHARGKHEHYGDGFTIDLNQPYEEVLGVVQEAVNDGVIRGTFDYKATRELDGAESATTSSAFPHWTDKGMVLYKIHPNTLAPEHFYESTDVGTVVVRYVVLALGPSSTRLRIDAVFEQDSHHYTRASDGSVESNEFEAISDRIKDLEDRAAERRRADALEEQLGKVKEIQTQLDQENARLGVLTDREQQLQKQVSGLQSGKSVRVRTASADLKAAPYNQSKTLQVLSQGEPVTLILQTPGWLRVRASNGTQGWVFGLMLEAAP
jgi:Bacterial SH3 domain